VYVVIPDNAHRNSRTRFRWRYKIYVQVRQGREEAFHIRRMYEYSLNFYRNVLNNNTSTISAHTVKFHTNITLHLIYNLQHVLVLRPSARKSTFNSSHLESTSELIILPFYDLVLVKIKLLLCYSN